MNWLTLNAETHSALRTEVKKSGSASSFASGPRQSPFGQLFVHVVPELVPGSGVALSHVGPRKVRERKDRRTLLVVVRPADRVLIVDFHGEPLSSRSRIYSEPLQDRRRRRASMRFTHNSASTMISGLLFFQLKNVTRLCVV
jgi:hypothetical protein